MTIPVLAELFNHPPVTAKQVRVNSATYRKLRTVENVFSTVEADPKSIRGKHRGCDITIDDTLKDGEFKYE